MKETIWKYDIKVGITDLYLPKDSEILCVQVQNAIPCIWARVNPENKTERRSFIVYGTGLTINLEDSKKYIGTFQLGKFVGHLFELIQK